MSSLSSSNTTTTTTTVTVQNDNEKGLNSPGGGSAGNDENGDSYLFAFDFDHTVVNDNSDTYITKLVKSPIPKEVKDFYNGKNWTEYMNKVFEWMAEQGVTIQEISKCVQGMAPTAGMVKLLKSLVEVTTNPNENSPASAKADSKPVPNVNLLVISDANDMFITDFLKAQVLSSESMPNLNSAVVTSTKITSPSPTFQFPFDIITNKASVPSTLPPTPVTTTTTTAPTQNGNNNESRGPGEIDGGVTSAAEALTITPYENQSSCNICPKNLCKGGAILKYIQEKGPFTRVFYTGDGGNDICPALKLSQHDYVFVRKGYRMYQKLEKSSDNLGITANIVIWEDADLIQSTIFENVLRDKL